MRLKEIIFVIVLITIGNCVKASTFITGDSISKERKNKLDEKPTSFTISGELKQRFEARNGYKTLVPDDTSAAFFVNNRLRLNIDFKSKYVDAYISMQDARVWGEYGDINKKGSFNLFEGYAIVPIVKGISVKIGRQRIMYDNQRLFAQNDWRVWGRAHDAARLTYKNNNTELEGLIAFHQNTENVFGTPYLSETSEDYKLLNVFWFKKDFKNNISLSLMHAGDGFESLETDKKIKMRFTDGGRIEWNNKKWYLTSAGYIQYGKTTSDKNILAWYLQPEIKYTGLKNTTIRLGAEFFSGQNVLGNDTVHFNSFVPLYGVAHRFNGSLDYFTRFPADTKNGGLLNPYLYLDYKLNEKIGFSSNFHYFCSEQKLIKAGDELNRTLGFEQDLLFKYNPHKIIGLEVGYSYIIPTESLEFVKNTTTNKFNQWAYVQLTIKPEFFKYSK